MERTSVPGGFLIEYSKEEIQGLNHLREAITSLVLEATNPSFKRTPEESKLELLRAQMVNNILYSVINENLPIEGALKLFEAMKGVSF